MRTFVALNIDAQERQRMYDALAPLRERNLPIRWTAAESLHITMKFLGEIEGVEVEPLDAALREVVGRHPPLHLAFSGVGAFPSLRRANVVWMGVQPNTHLDRLQRDAELAMSRLGYIREQRAFRAHVTVGRTSSASRAPDLERFAGLIEYNGVCDVSTVDLMRSHQAPGGSRYEPLLRWPLDGRADS